MDWELVHSRLGRDLETAVAQKRVSHARAVAQVGRRLAVVYGLNPDAMETAALLHDLTKDWEPTRHHDFLGLRGVMDKDLLSCPAIWHAVSAAILGEEEYGLPAMITEAVRWHTTGRAQMSLFEIILYVSDKIEPERSWGSEDLLLQAEQNLAEVMQQSVALTLEYMTKKGTMIHPDSISCWNWLCLKEYESFEKNRQFVTPMDS